MLTSSRALLLVLSLLLSGLAVAEEAYWEYTLRPGDTIWKVAKIYTTSANNWRKITEFNRVASGEDLILKPGTRIKIPVSLLKVKPARAKVVALHGNVRIIEKSGNTVKATTRSKLRSGDQIITSEASSVTLRFADGSELLLLANSRAQMDTLSAHGDNGMVDTRVRLKSGQIDTRVNKLRKDSRFEIITPTAVAAVRGTAFRISADGDIMRNEVTEGVVNVAANQQAKNLDAGYGLIAEKGKPLPEPVKLLPAPMLSENFYITEYRQSINWSAVDGAVRYRIQLAPTPAFNQLIFDRISEQNYTTISGLDNKVYALRVRAIDKHGLQGLNASTLLDVSILPAAADLQVSQSGKRLQFSWTHDDNIANTAIDVARDADFKDMVQSLQVEDTTVSTDVLQNGVYYYRNKRTDKRGVSGGYSETRSIEIKDENLWPFFIGAGVIILLL